MKRLAFSIGLIALLAGCNSEPITPKPKAHIRIDLPEKEYVRLPVHKSPFSFEIPTYSRFSPLKLEKSWWLWSFPTCNAEVYLFYYPIEDNLAGLIQDCHTLVNQHQIKASAIEITPFKGATANGGLYFDLLGPVASPYQFFITDSTDHFLRGELYFKQNGNPDSLAPVKAFLVEDIQRLTQSLHWK